MKAVLLSVVTGIFLAIAFAAAVAHWGQTPHQLQTAWDPAADHMRQHLLERPLTGKPSQP